MLVDPIWASETLPDDDITVPACATANLKSFGEHGEQVAPEKDEATLLLDFALQELTLAEE